MKKRNTFVGLTAIVLLFTIFVLLGCSSIKGLTAAQCYEIRNTYLHNKGLNSITGIGRIRIIRYLGTYEDRIAVKIYDSKLLKWDTLSQDGLTVGEVNVGVENDCEVFMLYVPKQNGQKESIYALTIAYEQGLLTQSDLEKIAELEREATQTD